MRSTPLTASGADDGWLGDRIGRWRRIAFSRLRIGQSVPEIIDTGFYWYNRTNINDEEIRAVLYE
jgi:hypothetical protein